MSMFVVISYYIDLYCMSPLEHAIWKYVLNIGEARTTSFDRAVQVQFPLSGRCFCGTFCKRVGETCAGGSRGKWQKHPNKHIQNSPIFEKSPFLGRTFASFFGGEVPTSWIVSVLGEVKILLRGKTCYLCDSLVIQHGLTVEVLLSDVTRSSSLSACPQAQKSPEINHFQKIF